MSGVTPGAPPRAAAAASAARGSRTSTVVVVIERSRRPRRRKGALREEPRERLRFRHERCELDVLVLRVEPRAARAEAVDGRDAKAGRGARVAAAADELRLAAAEAMRERARGVVGAQ